jgi:hypothetical protein
MNNDVQGGQTPSGSKTLPRVNYTLGKSLVTHTLGRTVTISPSKLKRVVLEDSMSVRAIMRRAHGCRVTT